MRKASKIRKRGGWTIGKSIRKKIVIGVLVIISLAVIVGLSGLIVEQQIAGYYTGFKDYRKIVDTAAEASSYAKRAEGHLLLYLLLNNETDKEKFPQRCASLEEQITLLDGAVVHPETIEQINVLKSYSEDILKYGTQLINLYNENPVTFNPKDHTELIRKFHDSSSGARAAGVFIVAIESSALNQDIEIATKHSEFTGWIIIYIVIATIIVSSSMGLLLAHLICNPIVKLRDAAIEIGKGKLDIKIDIASNDEIGDLAHTFNKMSQNLKNHHEQLQKKTEEILESNKALDTKISELERYKELTVGRELKMIEMKKEIDMLLKKLGEKPRYEK